MYCRMRTGAALYVLGAELVLIPMVAVGQAAGPANPSGQTASASGAAAGGDQLAEIIVTAQKRSQSISEVGMSITALSGAQLQEQGITDVAGLSKIDPSFVVSQSFYGTPIYTIRGVGYNDFSLAASPTVSVYTDEVPYPYLALTKAVSFDLERVEVLKGPQGTLFGQNATGGAVNYVNAKPTATLTAGFGASYTDWNAANFNGFISGPLTDTLSGRLAFDINEGGAWQKSESRPDDRLGDLDQIRLRGMLEWRPVDSLRVAMTVTGWRDNSDTLAPQAIGLVPANPGSYPNTPFANPALAGRTYASIVGLTPLPFPTADTQAEWAANSFPRADEHDYQVSGRVEYEVSQQLMLTYVGSYQRYEQNDLYDNTGTLEAQNTQTSGLVTSGYNELRLSGRLFDSKVDWLLGGDYSRVTTDEDQFSHLGTTAAFGLIQLPVLLHLSTHYLDPFNSLRNISTDRNTSKAVFANLEYHLTADFAVHGGIRYTSTDIDHSECSYDADGNLAAGFNYLLLTQRIVLTPPLGQGSCVTLGPARTPQIYTGQLDQNNVSWRVGADWHPLSQTLVYATVSKGYKSGNFPTLPSSDYVQLLPVTQESVLAYEIGSKSRLLDERLEVDGAVFYYDYRDKQLSSAVPDPLRIFGVLNAIVNIPKSSEKGAELAVKYRPIQGLTLTASTTYLDSRVDGDFPGYNPYSLNATINLKGEPFPNTPKWSARLGGQYSWEILPGRYSAYVGLDGNYVGSSQGQFGNNSAVAEGFPSLEIASYATLDLRAGLDSDDGHWRFQVFGRNVTNKYYWTQAIHIDDAAVRFAGMPATFGASVAYRY